MSEAKPTPVRWEREPVGALIALWTNPGYENWVVFDGPDREANVALFIHAGELVEAAREMANRVRIEAHESLWADDKYWQESRPAEYQAWLAMNAIIAKIDQHKEQAG